ncbi:MAG TPA: hypothetical protein VNH11_12060 [Pirellulales bacterium]|nr:hypothetical protein [Pirellulales bacterium]
MARTPADPNKTDLIRQYLARRPNATALEAVRGIKREMGIDVSVGLVAKVKRDASAAPAVSSNGTTKADQIREVAKSLPKPVRPRDVVATLAEQGVKASSAQVSQVLKGMGLKRRRRAGRRAGPRSVVVETVASTLTLDSLLAAKKLAVHLGSVEAAKTAVDALAKLG